MDEALNLGAEVTQEAFGSLVGIDQSAVSRLAAGGVLPVPLTVGAGLLAYCSRLREQAAGRMGSESGGLDLAQERAALARSQREGIDLKNAVLRGEYASVTLLGEVLATASQTVAERFDHLPGQLRKACPDLPPAAVDQVMATIASARNEWVRSTAALASAGLDQGDDDDGPGTPVEGDAPGDD